MMKKPSHVKIRANARLREWMEPALDHPGRYLPEKTPPYLRSDTRQWAEKQRLIERVKATDEEMETQGLYKRWQYRLTKAGEAYLTNSYFE